jgi:hypothetical protein
MRISARQGSADDVWRAVEESIERNTSNGPIGSSSEETRMNAAMIALSLVVQEPVRPFAHPALSAVSGRLGLGQRPPHEHRAGGGHSRHAQESRPVAGLLRDETEHA